MVLTTQLTYLSQNKPLAYHKITIQYQVCNFDAFKNLSIKFQQPVRYQIVLNVIHGKILGATILSIIRYTKRKCQKLRHARAAVSKWCNSSVQVRKKKEIETIKEYQETCIKFDLKEGNLYFCTQYVFCTSVDFEIRQLLGNMYIR